MWRSRCRPALCRGRAEDIGTQILRRYLALKRSLNCAATLRRYRTAALPIRHDLNRRAQQGSERSGAASGLYRLRKSSIHAGRYTRHVY